tara:strand:- start:6450 stop:6836 length:387 start_codon:yes stop_codon:yes gene_type:complete
MAKKNVMSLSAEPEIQDRFRRAAKVRGLSVSKFIRELVISHLDDEEGGGVEKLSLQLDDDAQNILSEAVRNKGTSESEVVSNAIKRFVVTDDKVPIVLKIPSEVRSDRKGLSDWLQVRVKYIVDKLAG